jgi:branched-chain amino acid transport system permease protein
MSSIPAPLRAVLPEIVLALVLIAAPFLLPPLGFSYDLLSRVLNWGLLGLGFDILFGLTGLLSFGQAAFYGAGGFVTAYLLVSGTITSVWLALAVGTLAAGIFGLLVGWLAVRRIGIYFTMITLAFAQMAYFLQNSPLSDYTGGENGIAGCRSRGWASEMPRSRSQPDCRCTGSGRDLRARLRARTSDRAVTVGTILVAIRENTPRVAMLGHDVPSYKLAAFVIAALYAGLAGGMLGVVSELHAPGRFMLETSGQLSSRRSSAGWHAGRASGRRRRVAVAARQSSGRSRIELALEADPRPAFIGLVIWFRRGICGEILHRARKTPGGGCAPRRESPDGSDRAGGRRAIRAQPFQPAATSFSRFPRRAPAEASSRWRSAGCPGTMAAEGCRRRLVRHQARNDPRRDRAERRRQEHAV